MKIGDAVISTELFDGPVISLSGQTFDFTSGDGIIKALSALVIAHDGEVVGAYSDDASGGEQ